jgi:hypothetical protein
MASRYQPHERFSESDRDKIAGRLQDAFADGRLDQPEFNNRLDKLYEVSTYGELEPLVQDLPPVRTHSTPAVARDTSAAPAPGTFPDRHRERHIERSRGRHPVLAAGGGFGGVVIVNVMIWAIIGVTSGHFPYFWPIWLLIPWTVMVLGALGGKRR